MVTSYQSFYEISNCRIARISLFCSTKNTGIASFSKVPYVLKVLALSYPDVAQFNIIGGQVLFLEVSQGIWE
jgi:hypothetical protein